MRFFVNPKTKKKKLAWRRAGAARAWWTFQDYAGDRTIRGSSRLGRGRAVPWCSRLANSSSSTRSTHCHSTWGVQPREAHGTTPIEEPKEKASFPPGTPPITSGIDSRSSREWVTSKTGTNALFSHPRKGL